ncbi:hypothetical protein GCM10009102_15760 [Sphingomonas insulae]|uniref:Uncharacterized protein n=1 Tax=Sphingomonas insulae TaxID=424800 RepID=A0ABN1HTB3_9SPHN
MSGSVYVVRRIGGRNSHPDLHRVHAIARAIPINMLRCNGEGRAAVYEGKRGLGGRQALA